MQFKTKDLLITVLPKVKATKEAIAEFCRVGSGLCKAPTIDRAVLQCGLGYTLCGSDTCYVHASNICPDCTHPPTYVLYDPFVIGDLEALAAARTELQAALKWIDELEAKGTVGPITTKQEAELVESNLTELLNQVREMKKNVK